MKIANALAANFIDQNMEYREEKAIGTTDFLESELEAMRTRLKETENQLSVFRNQYMGELPEQLQSNLQLLSSLETQLNNRQERLRDERSRLQIAQSEIEQIRRELQNVSNPAGRNRLRARRRSGRPMTLPQLREQLASLQGVYTGPAPGRGPPEKHDRGNGGQGACPGPDAAPRGAGTAPENLQGLSSPQLREAMQAADGGGSEPRQHPDRSQPDQSADPRIPAADRADAAARRAAAVSQARLRQHSERPTSLCWRARREADMAVSMQKKNKGEQFRVIDYAKLPEKPVSPDMRRLFLMFTAAGLGFGAAIIFLAEFFDTSVRKPEDFQERLSLPVLMVMPEMEPVPSRRSRLLSWLNQCLSAAGVFVCLGLLACLASVTVLNDPRVAQMIKGLAM